MGPTCFNLCLLNVSYYYILFSCSFSISNLLCVVFVRRAHLKECFETLKKNIPNIDEKKTSNLSVLRSALRYIQVSRSRRSLFLSARRLNFASR